MKENHPWRTHLLPTKMEDPPYIKKILPLDLALSRWILIPSG